MAQQMAKPIPPQRGNETRSAPRDQGVFKAILSEDIEWKVFAAFPPSARLASLWVGPLNLGSIRSGSRCRMASN